MEEMVKKETAQQTKSMVWLSLLHLPHPIFVSRESLSRQQVEVEEVDVEQQRV
jgi:hypothetical protein